MCTILRGTNRRFSKLICTGKLLTDNVHLYTFTDIYWRLFLLNVCIKIVHVVLIIFVRWFAGVCLCVFVRVFVFVRVCVCVFVCVFV